MYAPLPLIKFFLWGLLAQISCICLLVFRGYLTIPPGPGYQIVLISQNILQGGWLDPEYYSILDKKFLVDSGKGASQIWQDLYSLTGDGQLYTKHCHLLIFLLLPFLFLFGHYGPFVLSLLILQMLFIAMYLFLRQLLGRTPSQLSGVILLFGSPLVFCGLSLSYDLLAATLVLLSCVLLSSRAVLAGFVCGVAIFVRPTNIFYGPCFLFFGWGRKQAVSAILGFSGAFGLFLLYNKSFWGGWFKPSHVRMPYYINGERIMNPDPSSFSWEIFSGHWVEKLFSFPNGFLLSAVPIWLLLLLPFFWKKIPHHKMVICILLTALLQCVLIFSYAGWSVSEFGNRYLLPCYGLLLVVVCLLMETSRFKRENL